MCHVSKKDGQVVPASLYWIKNEKKERENIHVTLGQPSSPRTIHFFVHLDNVSRKLD